MTDRELMQMALEALEAWQKTCLDCGRGSDELAKATKPIKALRDRLAQPEYEFECPRCGHCCQQREWVGLTDEEITDLWAGVSSNDDEISIWKLGHAIEAKLKEKNT